MRRTRHVVLPVRSWEHVGLMVVSLACLTLGLVSRDREGQAGSLAGPDLQHCAPHKVDACPNEDVFARLLSYDDSVTPSGLIPTDQTNEYRTILSRNADFLHYRENRFRRDNRDARSTRRASEVKISRSEDGRSAEHRNIRLSDRRTRLTRDSRSLERDFTVRNYQVATDRRGSERRNELRNQHTRMPRSVQPDSVIRNSRSAVERMTERRNDKLRSFERDLVTRTSRLATERRDTRVPETRDDRRNRQTQAPRFIQRSFSSRKPELVIERSTERRSAQISGRREEGGVSSKSYRLAVERRDDQRSRQVRGLRSLDRNSDVRNSRLTSEHRDRLNTRSVDRVASVTRNVENLEERNSRLVTERRDVRLSERRGDQRTRRTRLTPILNRSALPKESERKTARLSIRRDAQRENREIRDARYYQRGNTVRNLDDVRNTIRDSATRSSQLVAERENRRSSRQVRQIRSVERNSEARDSRLADEHRDIRLSERRDDQRTRRTRLTSFLVRSSTLENSRLAEDSETERRDSRLSVGQGNREKRREARVTRFNQRDTVIRNSRDTRSLERDSTTRNLELVAERKGDRLNRQVRRTRSLDRDADDRNSRVVVERRDTRRERREVRDARSYRRDTTIRNSPVESDSTIRSSQLLTERGDNRSNRQIRGTRSLERDSRMTNIKLTEARRDSRLSERRDESLARHPRDIRSLRQNTPSRNLRSKFERRDNRMNDQIRNAKSLERDLSVRDVRSVDERRDDRLIRKTRSLLYTERDSSIRTSSLIESERVWINSLRDSRNVRKQSIATNNARLPNASMRRSATQESTASEGRIDRSSRLRRATDRRQAVLQIRENVTRNQRSRVERKEERTLRVRDSAITRLERNHDNDRVGGAKVPVTLGLRENNYDTRDRATVRLGSRLVSANTWTDNIAFPSSSNNQGLRQTAILILCALYGASLYSGKGFISRNIITYINRIVIW